MPYDKTISIMSVGLVCSYMGFELECQLWGVKIEVHSAKETTDKVNFGLR
jgi:hypothetical protein